MPLKLKSLISQRHRQMAAMQQVAHHNRRLLLSGATVAAAATLAVGVRHRRQLKTAERLLKQPTDQRFMHPLVIHAISGAMGELCQSAALYPLSTIKVRCRAYGASSRTIVQQLLGLGSKRAGLRSLYAGLGATAISSAAIGAVYLATFCLASQQLASLSQRMQAPHSKRRQKQNGPASTHRLGSDMLAAAAQVLQPLPALTKTNGRDLQHDAAAAAAAAMVAATASGLPSLPSEAAGAAASSNSRPMSSDSQHGVPAAVTLTARGGALDTEFAIRSAPDSSSSSSRNRVATGKQRRQEGAGAAVDAAAALAASLTTSFIEGPVELFRNRAQADGGSVVVEMLSAFRTSGLAGVFGSYSAFMLKALPEDVAELVVYSQLSAARKAKPSDRSHPLSAPLQLLRKVPDEVADLLMGAIAGASAVLCVTPMDCIKTYMDAQRVPAAKGLLPTVGRYWQTGRLLIARSGPTALFAGLGMHMAEAVPAAMVYWLAVETCRRALAPYSTGNVSTA